MKTKDLISEFVKYAEETLLPKLNAIGRNVFYIGIGCLLDQDDLDGKLAAIGVVKPDGTLNLDRLKAGIMFDLDKHGGVIELFDFLMTSADVETFFRRIQQSS